MKLTCLPADITVQIAPGETLLAAAAAAGLVIDADCGSAGKCGKCKVRISRGKASPLSETERQLLSETERALGVRLACCTRAEEDITIILSGSSEGSTRKKDMAQLPSDFSLAPARADARYGVAFDIGTTTVVGTLWDLNSGTALSSSARGNDQRVFGADVISRIQYAMKGPQELTQLQEKVLFTLQSILTELCLDAELPPQLIDELSLAGNTTMSHLLLGINPVTLARMPFTPVFTEGKSFPAGDLGLSLSPCAMAHLLPNIAGHVGSDITAMMLSAGLDRLPGNHVAVDIGTNGEVVAVRNGRLLCCSTAAGPAFEGASIRSGMRAALGAIERVELSGDDIALGVIGGTAPCGLCGSGLMDAIAAALQCGALLPSGRLLSSEEAEDESLSPAIAARLTEENGIPAFMLAERKDGTPILLTQQDIREVQLAKAAICAGIETLLQELGIGEEELDSILLAGAFGSHIRPESALAIGLLPPVPLEKIRSIGNAAGAGASMALLSRHERERAADLARATRHVELSTHESFQDLYIDAMAFPE